MPATALSTFAAVAFVAELDAGRHRAVRVRAVCRGADGEASLAQKAEWERCRKSPAYFIERHCQVYDATARVWLPFGLWPAQRDVLIDLEQHRLTVILKARQLGLSWLVVGWALWLMLFQPAATVLFFSKRDQEAVHLLAFRLRGMLDRLPDWLRPVLVADNDHNIELANGSVGLAFPTTGGRSYTASLVVVDEADFADNLDALLAAVKPTIDAGGRLILLSTADKSEAAERLQADLRGGQAGRERVPGDLPALDGSTGAVGGVVRGAEA